MTSLDLARGVDAVPVVATTTDRDTRFPLPQTDQRVYVKGTGETQRWDGTTWVVDAPTFSGGLVAIGQSQAYGRADAQIEAQNDYAGSYHALISIFNRKNPGDTTQEAALSYEAFNSAGVVRQVASISAMWANNATDTNGIGVLRLNVDTVVGGSDIALRIFANNGIAMFGTSDSISPGGRFLQITRTTNIPSIAGTADLCLDANPGTTSGTANTVFLNAYNQGDVIAAQGGGRFVVGSMPTLPTGTTFVALANTTAPTGTPTGGGVLYVSGGALKYVGTSGTVTTLAVA